MRVLGEGVGGIVYRFCGNVQTARGCVVARGIGLEEGELDGGGIVLGVEEGLGVGQGQGVHVDGGFPFEVQRRQARACAMKKMTVGSSSSSGSGASQV